MESKKKNRVAQHCFSDMHEIVKCDVNLFFYYSVDINSLLVLVKSQAIYNLTDFKSESTFIIIHLQIP